MILDDESGRDVGWASIRLQTMGGLGCAPKVARRGVFWTAEGVILDF
jgi:hypothetical protein